MFQRSLKAIVLPITGSFYIHALTCSYILRALHRYRLSLLVTDPADSPNDHDLPTEIVGYPVDTLVNTGGGFGSLIPTRITALYGKQFKIRLSVSSHLSKRQKIAIKLTVSLVFQVYQRCATY